jgi:hypothetical protein
MKIIEFFKDILRKFAPPRHDILGIKQILISNYLEQNLFRGARYQDEKRLNKYEYQVYSQNGEDGIIHEIFKRIGTTNKFFVEFGSANGIECNTLLLLMQDWKGCWLDGSDENLKFIKQKFGFMIGKQLSVMKSFITAENIEESFTSLKVPKEFDLLSIDIDGNDYWVWKAISNYRPRVVIIELNPLFPPPIEFIINYDAHKIYPPTTSHSGASLKALEILGKKKGYALVGCNFLGGNAFFVREDLVGDHFLRPFTAENHYESPKDFLTMKNGHDRDFGEFMNHDNNLLA